MTNAHVQINVIIPCRAPAPWLREAIASVLAQQVDLDVCVVDDGSADDSVGHCVASFADPRVVLLRQAPGGPSAARNAGAAQGRAPWCMFLDADDVLCEHALARLLQSGRRHGGVVMGAWRDADASLKTVVEDRRLDACALDNGLAHIVMVSPPAGTVLVPRTDERWDEVRRVWEVTRYFNRVTERVGRLSCIGEYVAIIRQHDGQNRVSRAERHFALDVEAQFWLEEYQWLASLGASGEAARRIAAVRLIGLAYMAVRAGTIETWTRSIMAHAQKDRWLKLIAPRLGSAAWSGSRFGIHGLRVFATINRALGR